MCRFSAESKEKTGNAIIYIAQHTKRLSKTKLLKLLYLMEERMVEKHHTPFLALPYEIWHLGPVQKDLFADLSDTLFLMQDYIEPHIEGSHTYFRAKRQFDDSEFSDCEIKVMDEILEKYKTKNSQQLIHFLHQPVSLWYKTAVRHNMLQSFQNGDCNSSDIRIDFGDLLNPEERAFYEESLAIHQTANALNAQFRVQGR